MAVVNGIDETELDEMIHKFDVTPAPELTLDINEYLKIYNWMKDLKLYHKLVGKFSDINKRR